MFNSNKFVEMKRLGIVLMVALGVVTGCAAGGSKEDKMIMECAKLYAGAFELFYDVWTPWVEKAKAQGTLDDSDVLAAHAEYRLTMEVVARNAVNYCSEDGEVTEFDICKGVKDLKAEDRELLFSLLNVSDPMELAKMIYSHYAAMPKSFELKKEEGDTPSYCNEEYNVKVYIDDGVIEACPYFRL